MKIQWIGPTDDASRIGHYCRLWVGALRASGAEVVSTPVSLIRGYAPQVLDFAKADANVVCLPGNIAQDFLSPGVPNTLLLFRPFPPVPADWGKSLRLYQNYRFATSAVASYFTVPGRTVAVPIDLSVKEKTTGYSSSDWLDWKLSGYRFYSSFSSYEGEACYNFLKTYLETFSSRDHACLVLRFLGEESEGLQRLESARVAVGRMRGQLPRVALRAGAWSDAEVGEICQWANCVILPWTGAGVPLELLYGMAAGCWVVGTKFFADGLLDKRSGTLLDFTPKGGYAHPSLSQISVVMRMAYQSGGKVRHPPIEAAKKFSFESRDWVKELLG